jgi:hypothetical protein
LTDQTATIARAKNADPVEIMLPLIRQLQRSCHPCATFLVRREAPLATNVN